MRAWLQRLRRKEPSPPTPEQEIALVGAALLADPADATGLARLDRLIDAVPDPLALVPLQEKNPVGALAVRAYVLHRLQRTPEAVGLILQCARTRPKTPYLRWAGAWVVQVPETVTEVIPFLEALQQDREARRALPAGLQPFLKLLLTLPREQTPSPLLFQVSRLPHREEEPLYFGTSLLAPAGEVISQGRKLLENPPDFDHDPQASFALTLSGVESPSAVAALRRQLGRAGFRGEVVLTVAALDRPDPRLPRRPLQRALWRYNGTDPVPAVEEPGERVGKALAQQAALPYDFDTWCGSGARLARELGAERLDQVHAALAIPPENPTRLPEWDWGQRVAIVAALVLAHADTGPWTRSRRRTYLLDLLAGPLDGSIEAAALALVAVVRQTPDAEADITRELLATLKHGENYSAPNLHAALICALLQMPSLKPVLRERLEETLTAVLS